MKTLQEATDAEIQQELARRHEIWKKEEQKRRQDHENWVVANAAELLHLVPAHNSAQKCTDDKVNDNGRCTRCALIQAREYQYFDSSHKLVVEIRLDYQEPIK